MTIRRGRCMNVQLCSMATSQKVIEIEADEPFICPRCSSDISPVVVRRASRGLRAVQAGALVLGLAGIGAKVYLDNQPKPPPAAATAASAPPASSMATAIPAPPPAPVAPFLRLGAPAGASVLAQRLAAGYLALSGDTDLHTQTTNGQVLVAGQSSAGPEAIAIASNASAPSDVTLSLSSARAAIADGARALGEDALALVANDSLPVAALSRVQLESILDGRVHNWADLGGAPGDIHIYVQAGSNGLADAPSVLLFPGIAAGAVARGLPGDEAVIAAVAKDGGAIGLVRAASAPRAHVLAVGDGGAAAVPTPQAIANGTYPLSRRASLSLGDGEAARRFADYAGSEAGQVAVRAAGFVADQAKSPPLAAATAPASPVPAVTPAMASIPSAAPPAADRFHQFIAGSSPAPVVFHFEQASTALDRAALRDLDRLVAFLHAHRVDGEHVILAGFSDNQGTQATKEAASQKRVAAVAAGLARAGFAVKSAEGFGADVAVADDSTSEGRDRNRRVEVYLLP